MTMKNIVSTITAAPVASRKAEYTCISAVDSKASRDFLRQSIQAGKHGFLAFLLIPSLLNAAGSEPVNGITTTTTAATSSAYTGTVDGEAYSWGTGSELELTAVTTASNPSISTNASVQSVVVRRVDNAVVTGERCSIFAQRSTGNSRTLIPTLDCDLENILAGNVINRGWLDTFANELPTGNKAANNIERIDFLFSPLVAPSTLAEMEGSGFLATEKSGNNPMVMAAITSLDSSGNPASYAPLIKVWPSSSTGEPIRYGIVSGTSTQYSFMLDAATAGAGQNGQPEYIGLSTESLGMAFISLDDLGLSANQIFFGFSYFSQDIYGTAFDPVDYLNFPTDTSGEGTVGDADIYGGAGAYISNTPQPPASDTDADGIFDLFEIGNNPSNPIDSDNDGTFDYLEVDSDGDGILDSFEAGNDPTDPTDSDGDGTYDYQEIDSDGDSILDSLEAGSDPTDPTDSDSDGTYDYQETDSDGDGILDTLEAGSDPTDPTDSDSDGSDRFRWGWHLRLSRDLRVTIIDGTDSDR